MAKDGGRPSAWALSGWTAPPETKAVYEYYSKLVSLILNASTDIESVAVHRATKYMLDKIIWGSQP